MLRIKFSACRQFSASKSASSPSAKTLHASVFELNKYAETTTPFIIYLSLSNFTIENLTFTQKSISKLKRQKKFVEKVCRKTLLKTANGIHFVATLCLHFVENSCGYYMFTFVIFVMESRFSGKFIFASENACFFNIFTQNHSLLPKKIQKRIKSYPIH